eukprot:scaffold8.g1734.t1
MAPSSSRWCGCNNSAMFAELVPEQLRSTIFAYDRSFEGGRRLVLSFLSFFPFNDASSFNAFERRLPALACDRSFEGAIAACGAPLVGLTAERLFGFRGAVGDAGVDAALHWTFGADRRRGGGGPGGPGAPPAAARRAAARDDLEGAPKPLAMAELATMRKRGAGSDG